MTNTTNNQRRRTAANKWRLALVGVLVLGALVVVAGEEQTASGKSDARSTAPSLERQLDAPSSQPASSSSPVVKATEASATGRAPLQKPQKPAVSLASQKKAAASQASAQNYDKYQLKASSSSAAQQLAASAAASALAADKAKSATESSAAISSTEASSSPAPAPAHKKAGPVQQKASGFALWRKFLPSFMTSAAAAAAAVSSATAAAAAATADKAPHSRSSPASGAEGPVALASGRIINLLSASLGGGASKKRGHAHYDAPAGSAIPNHAPFFMRKSAADRQAGGGAAALASSLLSNPLKLGLLFSAPLLPSLLLTPLALAGLSPAMSAINNFFDDDDEPAAAGSATQASGPLAALAQGPNSPLANILQATGMSRFAPQPTASPASNGNSADSSSSPSTGSALALQAFQSLLMGPTSTTERPLFNPGMFASSSASGAGAVQQAMGSLASSLGQSNSQSSSSSSRPMFGSGGSLIQTAASMISPSFAAPPTGSQDDDSGNSGIMSMASEVFEKVANYMGQDNASKSPVGQASGAQAASANSPLSTLASLSSLSPFQLSSLFAPTAFGSALTSGGNGPQQAGGSGAAGPTTQRAGFFSTLRNVYELFSSSFLRRQEVAGESSNECQQRLVCELHQRAMNSKLFRRSLQSNLMELANLDKNLLEQLKFSAGQAQARVDPDTRAMLSDFLKASNNFKQGREMINCGQMFPKCSRTQLLAAANAHLNDPANGRTLGKFSQLMKKMKFKAQQQHQSQWKLRKPNKNVAATRTTPAALDYLQVAPLSAQKSPAAAATVMAPVDSLKLAQQLMYLSQMSGQPQQQQQQQINTMASSQYVPPPPPQPPPQPSVAQSQQQQQVSYEPAVNYGSYAQYSPAVNKQQTTYTDADTPLYSSVAPSSGQQQSYVDLSTNQQQQQQQQSQSQQQQVFNGAVSQYQSSSYQSSSYTPEPVQQMTSVAGGQQQVAPLADKQPAKQMLAGH